MRPIARSRPVSACLGLTPTASEVPGGADRRLADPMGAMTNLDCRYRSSNEHLAGLRLCAQASPEGLFASAVGCSALAGAPQRSRTLLAGVREGPRARSGANRSYQGQNVAGSRDQSGTNSAGRLLVSRPYSTGSNRRPIKSDRAVRWKPWRSRSPARCYPIHHGGNPHQRTLFPPSGKTRTASPQPLSPSRHDAVPWYRPRLCRRQRATSTRWWTLRCR